MNDKQLLTRLVKQYKNCLDEVSKLNGLNYIDSKLYDYGVDSGICLCSNSIFGVSIYDRSWVKTNKKFDGWNYLFKPPFLCNTKTTKINSLKKRIDYMEKLLKQM